MFHFRIFFFFACLEDVTTYILSPGHSKCSLLIIPNLQFLNNLLCQIESNHMANIKSLTHSKTSER